MSHTEGNVQEGRVRGPELSRGGQWYHRLTANSICRTAGYLLGLIYLKREGVPENHAKAFKRFSQASMGGHRVTPQECLGWILENDKESHQARDADFSAGGDSF